MIETANGWNASSNVNSVLHAITQIPKKVKKSTAAKIRNVGAMILKQAKQNAPVISGALRRSGRLEKLSPAGKNYVNLIVAFGGPGTGVDYAHLVEFGTRKQQGHFYLLKAVRKFSKQLAPFNSKAFELTWNQEAKISNLKKVI